MLCFRCGSYNPDGVRRCDVCGQTFVEKSGAVGVAAPPPPKEKPAAAGLFAKGDLIAKRYKVKDTIGQGGVGIVYRVRDEEIDADIALKVIFANLLQTDEERKLFAKQIKLARKLHHPNIVRIYDEGHDLERRFFTMKLLEGLTLRKIIRLRHDKGQPFTPEEIIPIFHQLGAALDYAHKTTWHGDLKPENILILPDLLKITDFNLVKGLPLKPFLGIAKSKNKGFPYIAPELRVEASRIDGRVDVYSLGVILCEMFTGLTFEGHFTRALTTALEKLPTKLDGLVRRALSEHPDGRFLKASELANELESALGAVTSSLPVPLGAPGAVDDKSKKNKLPPPPPEETRPGEKVVTAEERGRPADKPKHATPFRSEEELEELGPSQVLLLDTGVSKALADSRIKASPLSEDDDDIATRPGVPEVSSQSDARTNSLDVKNRKKFRAEDLVDTLYSSEDDESLIPPPLPSDDALDASDSYESLPAGVIAVSGDGGHQSLFPPDPPTFADDPDSSEEEPTLSDLGQKLRIHDELTALKDSGAPGLVPRDEPPPLPPGGGNDHDDSLDETLGPDELRKAQERSSPRLRSATPLSIPVVTPKTQEPTLKRLRPVAPPVVNRRPAPGVFIAGVVAMIAVVAVGVAVFLPKAPSNTDVNVVPVSGPGFATVGVSGGTVELDGVSVQIPPGALATDVTVRITRSDGAPPDGFDLFSPVYRFSPAGTSFAKPVRVIIPFTGDVNRAGLFWASEGEPYRRLEGALAGNAASALVTHFSTGFVGAERVVESTSDAGVVVALVNVENPALDEAAIRAKEDEAKRIEEERRRQEDDDRRREDEKRANERKEQDRRDAERRDEEKRKGDVDKGKRDAELRAKAEMDAREREENKRRDDEERRRKADDDKRKKEEDAKRKADDEARKKEEEARKKEEAAKLAGVEKKCPKGMVMIKSGSFTMGSSPSDPMRNFGEKDSSSVNVSTYCIDYYEYPNSKSQPPVTGVSFNTAKGACEKKGKRLCTEAEWERACKGPGNQRFPYGNTYDTNACNTEDEAGNPRPLGGANDFKKCRSGFTVFSLAGNAEEWTSDDFKAGGASKVVKGGAADRPDWASRCAARRGLSPGTSKSTLGVRCCADPE